jgi:hypothetical protein
MIKDVQDAKRFAFRSTTAYGPSQVGRRASTDLEAGWRNQKGGWESADILCELTMLSDLPSCVGMHSVDKTHDSSAVLWVTLN